MLMFKPTTWRWLASDSYMFQETPTCRNTCRVPRQVTLLEGTDDIGGHSKTWVEPVDGGEQGHEALEDGEGRV